jgi:hypothetical protein
MCCQQLSAFKFVNIVGSDAETCGLSRESSEAARVGIWPESLKKSG